MMTRLISLRSMGKLVGDTQKSPCCYGAKLMDGYLSAWGYGYGIRTRSRWVNWGGHLSLEDPSFCYLMLTAP